jgi:hypothetical protein
MEALAGFENTHWGCYCGSVLASEVFECQEGLVHSELLGWAGHRHEKMKFKFLLLKIKLLCFHKFHSASCQPRKHSSLPPNCVTHQTYSSNPVQEKQYCISFGSEMHRPLFFTVTQLPSSDAAVGATTASSPSAASMPPRAQFVVHSDLTVTQQSVTPRPRDQLPTCLSTFSLHGAQVIRSENIRKSKLCLPIHFSRS